MATRLQTCQAILPAAGLAMSEREVQLLEDEMDAGHFGQAALLAECIGICRAYRADRVIAINIRLRLRPLVADEAEADLFAALLVRHVRDPADHALYIAAKSVWDRIKQGGAAANVLPA